jgi:hypothetical protein
MSDIRLAFSFRNHRKRKKANKLLNLKPSVTDYLIDLWLATGENHPDGILRGMDEEDIAIEAGWEGDATEFVTVLKKTGFLDNDDGTYRIHDWEDHQRWIIHRPQRVERARKAAFAKHAKDKKNQDSKTNESAKRMPKAYNKHATKHAPSPSPSPSPKQKDSGRAAVNLKPKNQKALLKDLETACDAIWKKDPTGKEFNPYQFAIKKTKDGIHPGAINLALETVLTFWDETGNKWGYCEAILKKQDFEFKDRDRVGRAKKDKIDFNKIVKAIEIVMKKVEIPK